MTETLPFRDPARPLDERVRDLVSRMTLEEKLSQMTHPARAIPRLGVPAYNYWNEALHGVARNGRATVFPQAIGMAATWDPALIREVAGAIADEGRAKHHEALRQKGETDWYQGLTFWSPNVNIYRDPRWGRGQETWGEDPHLTGEMGSAFVRGLQGDDPKYLKAAACAKHFAVHSGPEKQRHGFDARVSLRDLHDTYLPAFRKLVTEAKVEAVMGAYNRVNGHPCCAHPYLMGEVLRGEWGFGGHFVSDCWAVADFLHGHKIVSDAAEAAALALKAGCDLECGDVYRKLGEALERGLITEADLDAALSRHLATRFKLGMFDPPEAVPYAQTPMSVVGSEAHRELAYRAAVKSVVLLKNKNGILPLRGVRSVGVTGPNAAAADVLLGNYHGLSDRLTTLLEGVVARVPEGVRLDYRLGTQLVHEAAYPIRGFPPELTSCDAVIACMGISPLLEGEEGESIGSAEKGDRSRIELPEVQAEFLRKLAAAGARIVLVLTGGGPVALGDLEDLVEAIVFVWYPGQEGGRAVASVLFGDEAPSGKLPVSFPRSTADLPPFEDYSMVPKPPQRPGDAGTRGRTYRYAEAEPQFPFGFGLSYTAFEYQGLKLERDRLQPGEPLRLEATVANTGPAAAEEVVQCYLQDLEASVPVPRCKLVGFTRVALEPGESRTVAFTLTPEQMSLVDEDGKLRLEPGEFRVTVGGCSPGERGLELGAPRPVGAVFTVGSHSR